MLSLPDNSFGSFCKLCKPEIELEELSYNVKLQSVLVVILYKQLNDQWCKDDERD